MEGDQPFFFLISSVLGERKSSRALLWVGVPFGTSLGDEFWLDEADTFRVLSTELSVSFVGATLLTDFKLKSETPWTVQSFSARL